MYLTESNFQERNRNFITAYRRNDENLDKNKQGMSTNNIFFLLFYKLCNRKAIYMRLIMF